MVPTEGTLQSATLPVRRIISSPTKAPFMLRLSSWGIDFLLIGPVVGGSMPASQTQWVTDGSGDEGFCSVNGVDQRIPEAKLAAIAAEKVQPVPWVCFV